MCQHRSTSRCHCDVAGDLPGGGGRPERPRPGRCTTRGCTARCGQVGVEGRSGPPESRRGRPRSGPRRRLRRPVRARPGRVGRHCVRSRPARRRPPASRGRCGASAGASAAQASSPRGRSRWQSAGRRSPRSRRGRAPRHPGRPGRSRRCLRAVPTSVPTGPPGVRLRPAATTPLQRRAGRVLPVRRRARSVQSRATGRSGGRRRRPARQHRDRAPLRARSRRSAPAPPGSRGGCRPSRGTARDRRRRCCVSSPSTRRQLAPDRRRDRRARRGRHRPDPRRDSRARATPGRLSDLVAPSVVELVSGAAPLRGEVHAVGSPRRSARTRASTVSKAQLRRHRGWL